MKVWELIKLFEKLDQDLPVMISGYEMGFDDVAFVEEIRYKPDANKGIWFYGRHGEVEHSNAKYPKAIQLKANSNYEEERHIKGS